MPTYEYSCHECGSRFERFLPLARYKEQQFCSCGCPATKSISRPQIMVESVEYDCPITGEHITSKVQHSENLKLHGCRVLETGEKEAAARFRKESDEKFDKSIEETVEKAFDAMPSDKKERLANELSAGVTAEVVRN